MWLTDRPFHSAPVPLSTSWALLLVLAGCSNGAGLTPSPQGPPTVEEVEMSLTLTSIAFDEGAPIPVQYTCDGDNVSPPLAWAGVPEHTRSLALVCDDPDAPAKTWVHWVLYDISPDVTELDEAVSDARVLPFGATNGTNDFKTLGYGGPCPPPGGPHRYYFRLYALDAALRLEPGASKSELEVAMQGHVLAEAQLMGTYERR